MNTMNIKPKYYDNFYAWANYDWMNNNKIPDDEVRYTHFLYVQNNINNELNNILETNKYPIATKLYKSYCDENYRENNSKSDIRMILNIIDKCENFKDLMYVATILLAYNVDIVFHVMIDANIYDSSKNT